MAPAVIGPGEQVVVTALAVQRPGRGRGNKWTALLSASPPVLLVIVFVGIPIVIGVAYTLGYTGGLNSVATSLAVSVHTAAGWAPTVSPYRSVFADARFRGDLGVTIWVTVMTVAVTLVLAWSIALYGRLSAGRWARLLAAVAVIPLFIPLVIGAYAIREFYLNTGFLVSLGKHVGLSLPSWSYHTTGIVIGQIWASLPFAVLLISAGLAAVPEALIDAARDAGASPARAVWSVMVPLATVPTVIVGTFTAVEVLGSFTIPYLIGPTAPNMLGVTLQKTYASYQRPQEAQVMAVVLFVLAAGIGVLYVWANARASRRTSVAA